MSARTSSKTPHRRHSRCSLLGNRYLLRRKVSMRTTFPRARTTYQGKVEITLRSPACRKDFCVGIPLCNERCRVLVHRTKSLYVRLSSGGNLKRRLTNKAVRNFAHTNIIARAHWPPSVADAKSKLRSSRLPVGPPASLPLHSAPPISNERGKCTMMMLKMPAVTGTAIRLEPCLHPAIGFSSHRPMRQAT